MNSEIILTKNINIDKNYINVLSYTETQMVDLCRTNAVAIGNDYSFIRDKGVIQTDFEYSKCLQANYIAFQNKDYSNKWFFAFIDKVEYKGNNCTNIYYSIDSWSTWYSYWTRKPCYIEREHATDDTPRKKYNSGKFRRWRFNL